MGYYYHSQNAADHRKVIEAAGRISAAKSQAEVESIKSQYSSRLAGRIGQSVAPPKTYGFDPGKNIAGVKLSGTAVPKTLRNQGVSTMIREPGGSSYVTQTSSGWSRITPASVTFVPTITQMRIEAERVKAAQPGPTQYKAGVAPLQRVQAQHLQAVMVPRSEKAKVQKLAVVDSYVAEGGATKPMVRSIPISTKGSEWKQSLGGGPMVGGTISARKDEPLLATSARVPLWGTTGIDIKTPTKKGWGVIKESAREQFGSFFGGTGLSRSEQYGRGLEKVQASSFIPALQTGELERRRQEQILSSREKRYKEELEGAMVKYEETGLVTFNKLTPASIVKEDLFARKRSNFPSFDKGIKEGTKFGQYEKRIEAAETPLEQSRIQSEMFGEQAKLLSQFKGEEKGISESIIPKTMGGKQKELRQADISLGITQPQLYKETLKESASTVLTYGVPLFGQAKYGAETILTKGENVGDMFRGLSERTEVEPLRTTFGIGTMTAGFYATGKVAEKLGPGVKATAIKTGEMFAKVGGKIKARATKISVTTQDFGLGLGELKEISPSKYGGKYEQVTYAEVKVGKETGLQKIKIEPPREGFNILVDKGRSTVTGKLIIEKQGGPTFEGGAKGIGSVDLKGKGYGKGEAILDLGKKKAGVSQTFSEFELLDSGAFFSKTKTSFTKQVSKSKLSKGLFEQKVSAYEEPGQVMERVGGDAGIKFQQMGELSYYSTPLKTFARRGSKLFTIEKKVGSIRQKAKKIKVSKAPSSRIEMKEVFGKTTGKVTQRKGLIQVEEMEGGFRLKTASVTDPLFGVGQVSKMTELPPSRPGFKDTISKLGKSKRAGFTGEVGIDYGTQKVSMGIDRKGRAASAAKGAVSVMEDAVKNTIKLKERKVLGKQLGRKYARTITTGIRRVKVSPYSFGMSMTKGESKTRGFMSGILVTPTTLQRGKTKQKAFQSFNFVEGQRQRDKIVSKTGTSQITRQQTTPGIGTPTIFTPLTPPGGFFGFPFGVEEGGAGGQFTRKRKRKGTKYGGKVTPSLTAIVQKISGPQIAKGRISGLEIRPLRA